MLERTIVLNSKTAKQRNTNNVPENFTIKFDRPLILPNDRRYKIALLKLQGNYTWYNIESALNNHQIRYSPDAGTTWKTITFPNGVYTYTDLNAYIHAIMKANGDSTVVDGFDVFNIELVFNLSTFLVEIILTSNYHFDIYTQAYGDLIGYDVAILTTTGSGQRLPDITRSLDSVQVSCSLVEESIVSGVYSDIIYTYPTATLSRSYSYQFEPTHLQYSPMLGNKIDSITMRTSDVNGALINLNNIHVEYTLIIREDV